MLSDIPLLSVLNAGMLLNGLSISNLICVFVLFSQKVRNLSKLYLDDATSLLKCMWPYIMALLGAKIEL